MIEAVNPFLANLKEATDESKFKALEVVDLLQLTDHPNTGVGSGFKKESFFVDDETKVSIFTKPELRVVSTGLNPSGRLVILYLIYHLQPQEDWINLKIEKIQNEFSCSRRTVFNGIKCLVSLCLIARRDKSTYWINPKYLFSGSRINYYKSTHEDCFIIRKVQRKKQ